MMGKELPLLNDIITIQDGIQHGIDFINITTFQNFLKYLNENPL